MAISDDDTLRRSARALRSQPEVGWRATEERVITEVRATPRGGWSVAVDDPAPASETGTLRVSDLVLGALLAQAVIGDPEYRVTSIEVHSDHDVLLGISVEMSGRYLVDLSVAAARAAEGCRSVVDDVVGARPDLPIRVVVLDVYH